MKSNQSLLTRFFSHNITLLVLSFVLAFSTWFIINASSETETNVTISDIPVTIELTDSAIEDGLQVFNGNNMTASVEVSGNRVTVGSLSASDIQISANQSSSILTPGTYTLSLSAKKTGLKSNYNIVSSVTPATITVFVDREKEQEFDIENHLSVQLSDNTHYASTSLSQNKVTVTGPETQVSQIDSVAVIDTISVDADDTQTLQEGIVYLDSDDKELDLPLVTSELETVEATITVLPVSSVSLTVNTVGEPDNCPAIDVLPKTVKIAGPQDELDRMLKENLVVGTVDFSKLKNTAHNLVFDIPVPSGCKVISGETSAGVNLDLSNYEKTTVTCKISGKIDSTKYVTEFATNNVTVTVYGPEDLIADISASDISVIADFSNLLDDINSTNAVSLSVPLTITLSGDYAACWIYDSYNANVNVSMK